MSREVTFNHYKEYTTGEEARGWWIDGKVIYRKTVEFGALPNATSKSVAHGISDIDKIVKIEGIARTSAGRTLLLPWVNIATHEHGISLEANLTYVIINTGYNRSDYTGYITLYYTKTTDTAD